MSPILSFLLLPGHVLEKGGRNHADMLLDLLGSSLGSQWDFLTFLVIGV